MTTAVPSIPALLRKRAADRPDAPAFTFVDYALDPNGFSETLTEDEDSPANGTSASMGRMLRDS